MRNVRLTKPLRKVILENIMYSMRAESAEQLDVSRQEQKWMAQEAKFMGYREAMEQALATFSSSKQVEDEWPELLQFIPQWATDPASVLRLPSTNVRNKQ